MGQEPKDGVKSEDDAERGEQKSLPSNSDSSSEHQQTGSSDVEEKSSDPDLVTWEGPSDPSNPRNWRKSHKWLATITASLYAFVVAVTSSMVAPAIPTVEQELHISRVEGQITFSVFVLGFAIGPLVLGPLSEVYGRKIILQSGTTFFLIWTLACSFVTSGGQLAAFRLLAGLGGSAILAIGGGILADCWAADERAHAIALFTLAPMVGPAIGPIAGGFITENTTWRWSFRAVTIACAVLQLAGIFALRETWAPLILHRKKVRLAKASGNTHLHTEYDDPEFKLSRHLWRALQRPCRLLATQPIIMAIALYTAYAYGLMFIMLGIFPRPFTSAQLYNEPLGIASLNYISLGLGFTIGTQGAAPLNKRIYRRLTARNGGTNLPEFRLPLIAPGSFLIPAGLFLYGWTVQTHQHWILPNIGAAMFSLGIIVIIQCCTAYVLDAYTHYAASAFASVAALRSLCGFLFPLFEPAMFSALGYGWASSLLAFVGIGIGIPAPLLLWKYGALLRSKSKYASG